MLKDAINSGGIPKNSEKSTSEKISEEKENSAEKRNDKKQNFSQRTAKKEKTNRKNIHILLVRCNKTLPIN